MSEVTSTQAASSSNSPAIAVEDFDHDTDVNPEVMDNARTLELNLEDAERLMPQPTTKAPWFGYESYADYGEEGLDAVADSYGDDMGRGGRTGPQSSDPSDTKDAGDASEGKGGGISSDIGDVTVQDNSTTNVNVGDVTFSASCSLNTSDTDGGDPNTGGNAPGHNKR